MPAEDQEPVAAEPRFAVVNGVEHEVCAGCGSVVGHGCPQSEPCDCGEFGAGRPAEAG